MYKLLLLAAFLYAAVADEMDPFRTNLLNDHNEKRRQATNAANMIELRWDSALEATAKAYLLRGCAGGFSHNPNRGCNYKNNGGKVGVTGSGCPTVGENWYSGAPDNKTAKDVAMGGAVAQWTDGRCTSWASPPLRCGSTGCSEKQNFYQSGSDSYGSCTQTSGQTLHWTQAMWATTTHVGCWYTTTCGTLCNYAPGGNMNLPSFGSMRESNVWKIGTPCSSCPSGYTTCTRGLCSAGSGTTTTTAAPTTTPPPASCAGSSTKPTNGGAGTCTTSTPSGSTCAMTCNTGYRLTSGSLTRTCYGQWSSVTAVCSAVTCAVSTTKPANGNTGTCTTAKTYGATCTLACNSGFTLTSGSLVRQCGSSGTWSAVTAVCSANTTPTTTPTPYVTCAGDPNTKPTSGNAGSCGTSKNAGQTCTMACNSGYTLASGSLTRTCGTDGQWSSGSGVVCRAPTPAPTYAPTPSPSTGYDYCESGPTSNLDTEFNSVELIGHASSISDVNGCPGSTGISDMTTMRVTLAQSQSYLLKFDRSTCRYIYRALAGAWVDWNQNGVWEDSEKLFAFSSTYGENEFTFTVPSTARLGTTRMRIQVQETSATTINPCAMFAWGDTKDYTINVIASTPQVTCAGNPNIKPVNGNYGSCLSTKSYGQTCTQRCSTGYTLTSGSLESKCGADGRYGTSTAVCTATGATTAAMETIAECGDTDEAPINGSAGTCGQRTLLGETCTQECSSGFTLTSGSLVRECTPNGLSESTAVCE